MDTRYEDKETVSPSTSRSELSGSRSATKAKRSPKKKITLLHLLQEVCASNESCIEWLKNRGFIPNIMFCPKCSRKMKFEVEDSALDGYMWVCQSCNDPPRYSTRHGSWMESKDVSLFNVLLLTYMWANGFTEAQIAKEATIELDEVKDWDEMFVDVCGSVLKKSISSKQCDGENSQKSGNKDSILLMWRKKNRYKDPFLELLKDADSL